MAVTPILIADQGPAATPAAYTVPASQELNPTSVFAEFDGSAAAGPFIPVLRFVAQSGETLSQTFPTGVILNTGDVARVTFAPFGFTASNRQASSVSEVAYVEGDAPITVTGTDPATADTLLTLPPVTLDGSTDVAVTFYCSDSTQQNCHLWVLLYDGATFVGYMGSQVVNGTGDVAAATQEYIINAVGQLRGVDRPSAGVHTFTVKGHKDLVNIPSPVLQADPRGSSGFLPLWASVTAYA